MSSLREVAKAIPGVVPLVHSAKLIFLRMQPRDRVFRNIYERNGWFGKDSVSGTGSSVDQTQGISEQLPVLWERYEVKRLLDAPCGDFHWMRSLVSQLDEYTGVDIVEPLIEANRQRYRMDGVTFRCADIVRDPLPAVDMILCRDGLVHLSYRDVWGAIRNMKASGSRFLLSTTFSARSENKDIPTGKWRPLNLTRAPFHFPAPLELVVEGCTERGDYYADKSLGLWRLDSLPTGPTQVRG
jgi:hypothetical protein